MAPVQATHFLIIGAGAAGLMTARELARAGRQVTILEARDRCGGRILPLPIAEFGYAAEGGAEFVHGAAIVTRTLMREAGLSLSPRGGTRWSTRTGTVAPDNASIPYADRFYQALEELAVDQPVAEFLERHFSERQYEALRRSVIRTVQGYDAADPNRFSTFALREEWTARDDGEHGRIAEGYGALTDYLASECRRSGAAIHLDANIAAIEDASGRVVARGPDGNTFEADAAILSVPLPLLSEIALPAAAQQHVAATSGIGFGNVVKILLRFDTPWWADYGGRDLSDLSFLISDARVPTWWTQYPAPHPPVLTGWFAGPRADTVPALDADALVEMGLASLAEIFGRSAEDIRTKLVASRAINWGNDPFARGAYSYATPQTRDALSLLRKPAGRISFSGEALYEGPDMGTVEAALASGQETAKLILGAGL